MELGRVENGATRCRESLWLWNLACQRSIGKRVKSLVFLFLIFPVYIFGLGKWRHSLVPPFKACLLPSLPILFQLLLLLVIHVIHVHLFRANGFGPQTDPHPETLIKLFLEPANLRQFSSLPFPSSLCSQYFPLLFSILLSIFFLGRLRQLRQLSSLPFLSRLSSLPFLGRLLNLILVLLLFLSLIFWMFKGDHSQIVSGNQTTGNHS